MVNWGEIGGSSTEPERRIFGISSRDNAVFLPDEIPSEVARTLRVFREGDKIGVALGATISLEAKELWRTLTFFERVTREGGLRKKGDRRDTFYNLLDLIFSAQTGKPRLAWNDKGQESPEEVTEREAREIEVAKEVLRMKFRKKKNDPVKKAFSCLEELAENKASPEIVRVLEFFYWLNETREGRGETALTTIKQARAGRPSIT